MDTGAEVTVVSVETYRSLKKSKPILQKPSRILFGPAHQLLREFMGKLSHKSSTFRDNILSSKDYGTTY